MSGKPFVAAISSPPGVRGCPDRVPNLPTTFQPRCIEPEDAMLWFRDILTAGTAHFGYLKSAGKFGIDGGTREVETMRALFADVKRRHARDLAFATPFHRVSLMLDEFQLGHFAAESRFVDGHVETLVEFLEARQYPYGLFSAERVRRRPFSRSLIERSETIALFHEAIVDGGGHRRGSQLVDEMASLVDPAGGGHRANAAFVAILEQNKFATLRGPTTRIGTLAGQVDVWRWGPAGRNLPCVLLVIRSGVPPSAYANLLATALVLVVLVPLRGRNRHAPRNHRS